MEWISYWSVLKMLINYTETYIPNAARIFVGTHLDRWVGRPSCRVGPIYKSRVCFSETMSRKPVQNKPLVDARIKMLKFISWSRNYPLFTEHEYSFPCSQQSAAVPMNEPEESNSQCHTKYFQIHFKIILLSMRRPPKYSISYRSSD
jgi:hypothetical protein